MSITPRKSNCSMAKAKSTCRSMASVYHLVALSRSETEMPTWSKCTSSPSCVRRLKGILQPDLVDADVALQSQAGDLGLDDVAVGQEGVPVGAIAGRRTGQQQVARPQLDHLGDIGDEVSDVEDHVFGGLVLAGGGGVSPGEGQGPRGVPETRRGQGTARWAGRSGRSWQRASRSRWPSDLAGTPGHGS